MENGITSETSVYMNCGSACALDRAIYAKSSYIVGLFIERS
jgi:hypothetical protein